jgi:hypothetical protein
MRIHPGKSVEFKTGSLAGVQLSVYDAQGKKITTLLNSLPSAGEHSIAFTETTAALPGGLYFLRFQAEGLVQTRKFIMAK